MGPIAGVVVALLSMVVIGTLTLYLAVYLLSHNPRKVLPSELLYSTVDKNGQKSGPHELPTLDDAPSVEISVVIPCFNERERLHLMLEEAIPYLNKTYGISWELLLVDDGSTDGTSDLALTWAADNEVYGEKLRVCILEKNRGKGGAVAHGMKHSRGRLILFADADGASRFSDVKKLANAVASGKEEGVAVGSRAHLVKTDAVVKRTFIRNLLMYGLHVLLFVFGIRSIKDTQCGFKLFTRRASAAIFPYLHTERWIFDVECLIIAMRKKLPIHEVSISWHEVEGSKIELARDSVLMAIDLVVIRLAYLFGIYRDR